MKIVKRINTNAAIAINGNKKEIVILGKGVGFPKVPYELTDISVIERIFYDIDPIYINILANLSNLTDAMGDIWGTVYVLSSFLGVLIYLRNEPAIYEIEQNTKKISVGAINYLKQDFNIAKSEFDIFEYQKKQEKRKLDDNELKNKETINYEKIKK